MRDEPGQVLGLSSGQADFPERLCKADAFAAQSHHLGPRGGSLEMKLWCAQAHNTATWPSSPHLWEWPSPVGTALPCGSGSALWEWPSQWEWLCPVGTALTCGSGSLLWELPSPVGAAFTYASCLHLWGWPSPMGTPLPCRSFPQLWTLPPAAGKASPDGQTPQKHTSGSAGVVNPPGSPLATRIPAWEARQYRCQVPSLWVRATRARGQVPRIRNGTAPGLTREAWPFRFLFFLAQIFLLSDSMNIKLNFNK